VRYATVYLVNVIKTNYALLILNPSSWKIKTRNILGENRE
jgi:hypothetical protein